MSNEQNIQEVKSAQRMIKWVGLGIIPSQENADRAQAILKRQAHEGAYDTNGDIDLTSAIRITKSLSMGIIPSEENCKLAEQDISRLIDSMREMDSEQLRNNYQRQR